MLLEKAKVGEAYIAERAGQVKASPARTPPHRQAVSGSWFQTPSTTTISASATSWRMAAAIWYSGEL